MPMLATYPKDVSIDENTCVYIKEIVGRVACIVFKAINFSMIVFQRVVKTLPKNVGSHEMTSASNEIVQLNDLC